MDRLQSLKVFVAVAEAESFAAGARAVGLSAPSATRGINDLEAALGARLFTRTTRRVRLTDGGLAYLEEVREILAQLQAADDSVAGAARMPVGRLRLTCPQEFGRIHISPILTDFLDRFPDVKAEVLMVDRIVNLVEEGYDIAVRIGHLPPSSLMASKVGEVRRVVCAAPDYIKARGRPDAPADLASHRLIATSGTGATSVWRFGRDSETTVQIDPQLTITSVAASIEVARQGWGLCRALSYQVAADLNAGRLKLVLEDHEPNPLPIHLVHHEGRRAAAKIRSFIDFAAGRLRKNSVLQQ
ncbi:LysR substrate-binding domain-containing protein [Aurantimonas sp. HBX-1]|uniref:LysR substrate-binding domain-containing protein n=1 Tax=Aurantimonas sp. HBX-1 TaxID=2906072 RepID=UPI001F18ED23|nr:LysR substrate-binding domain-containing protein [Aurantimonas sp. HBX-1]UIJ73462.1 LysR substrate-binding domain-containing protein [Aurantimonas sp. HBX-1]